MFDAAAVQTNVDGFRHCFHHINEPAGTLTVRARPPATLAAVHPPKHLWRYRQTVFVLHQRYLRRRTVS